MARCNFNFCLAVLFGLWSWNLLEKRTKKFAQTESFEILYPCTYYIYSRLEKKVFAKPQCEGVCGKSESFHFFLPCRNLWSHFQALLQCAKDDEESKLENEKWISAHCTQKRQKLSGGGGQKLLGTKWWKHFCQAENEGYSCVSYFHNKVGTDPFLSLRGMIYKSSPWQPGNSICTTTTAPITNIPPFWSMPPALHCKWS